MFSSGLVQIFSYGWCWSAIVVCQKIHGDKHRASTKNMHNDMTTAHHFCSIHWAISLRKTLLSCLPILCLREGAARAKWENWRPFVPAGRTGCIITAIDGKDLGLMLSGVKNNFPLGSRSLTFTLTLWICCPSFVVCLALLLLLILDDGFPGELRISADGFMRSRNRRILLPRLRPTSMSLPCMFLWNLTATSRALRTLLQMHQQWDRLTQPTLRRFHYFYQKE